jgi:hypothetical protein
MRLLIQDASQDLGIPEELIHRVVQRESGYNPAARNGPYYGLMQINPQTARTMGYEGPTRPPRRRDQPALGRGLPARRLDRRRRRHGRGGGLVLRGYYYEARDRGLLVETGLRDSELR